MMAPLPVAVVALATPADHTLSNPPLLTVVPIVVPPRF
jgi:hypothetical protein